MLMMGEWGMSWARNSSTAFSKGRAANHSATRPRMTSMCFGRSRALANRGVRGSHREDAPVPVEGLIGAARPSCVLEIPPLADHALPAVERGRVLHDAER